MMKSEKISLFYYTLDAQKASSKMIVYLVVCYLVTN